MERGVASVRFICLNLGDTRSIVHIYVRAFREDAYPYTTNVIVQPAVDEPTRPRYRLPPVFYGENCPNWVAAPYTSQCRITFLPFQNSSASISNATAATSAFPLSFPQPPN